jgi:hypothetical protein
MAIANIIARGIGFNPGSVSFIPTHGFGIGEAALPPRIAGMPDHRRWYIYPDGRRLYQTPDEARDAVRRFNSRVKRPKKIREAIQATLEEGEEPALLIDLGLFAEIDLPSLPGIIFDFAPPLIDNTALEMIYLRTQAAQLRIARRRAEEEALLALLLA